MKVLVDTMNLVFINFNASKNSIIKEKGEFLEKDIGLFYHFFLGRVNDLVKQYGKIIFCTEGKGSLDWRREIYPAYKRNRDESKKTEDYNIIKKEFKNIEEVIKLYPTKFISVEKAEADDTIYALATHFASLGEDVLVVSGDGDLTQLSLFNPLIRVYDPRKREIVIPKKDVIKYKAIVGDRADGISGLPRLGDKTFEKMMLDESFFAEKIAGKEEEYEALLKIVDLRRFPQEIHKNALDIYNETEWNEFNPEDIEVFMYERGLVQQLQYWWSNASDISEAIGNPQSLKQEVGDFGDIDIDNLLETLRKENI